MKLGEKILKLRKKNGLSQEELGERINVTRQTISNWELGETTPNTEQLKLLSKEFNISIDDLLDNDVKSILVDKVSNTEKNTKTIIMILVGIVATIIFIFLCLVAARIVYKATRNTGRRLEESIICSIYGEYHSYSITYEELTGIPRELGGDPYFSDILELDKYNDAHQIFNIINDYVKKNNGSCIRVTESNINDYLDLFVKEGTLTNKGLTLLMKIKDEYDYTLTFGEEFFLEKLNNKTNKYESVKSKTECAYNEIAFVLKPGKEFELSQEWGGCFGSLDKGSYRLTKNGSIESFNIYDFLFSIEFEIE